MNGAKQNTYMVDYSSTTCNANFTGADRKVGTSLAKDITPVLLL
jgi:hypothetical protein